MIQHADPRIRPILGADVGATLAKLVIRGAAGATDYRIVPADGIEQLAREVESLDPIHVGITGGGAPELAALLDLDTARIDEFRAWAAGANRLQRDEGLDPAERYLLVSLGTGTSVLLVEGGQAVRVGGTALGGGTAAGLGAALVGPTSFEELVGLADAGDRRRVDLLVSEIYRSGDSPLPGDLNAASFAKLAPGREGRGDGPNGPASGASRADLAHAVMGLVGENVALIATGLAAATDVKRIVFGGSTLRGNQPLVEILRGLCSVLGREPVFPAHGEFTGALGALELAATEAASAAERRAQ